MTYDLRTEPWIPWRRRRSGVVWGPIAMLVDRLDGDDPVIAIASPRPDFDGALQEFLIGLLSVALKAKDEEEWRERWDQPPTVAELQAALDALPPAFSLDAAEGPRFLQDFSAMDLASQEVLAIDRLAIDSPGEQTAKDNKTLFVKPARFEQLSRPVAAMVLVTMQTYAPAGGQGNRTSMRGGGPLTTIADPRQSVDGVHADEQPLWQKLWISAETIEAWCARSPNGGPPTNENIYPWLAPTRVSDSKKPPVTPARVHAMQSYFGMPRRIRLEFGAAGRCGLTGRPDEHVVTGFRMRNFGVEYSGWRHPLSPHYAKHDEWLPVHPQPGGLAWRDWPDLTVAGAREAREPAAAIVSATRRARSLDLPELRLHAFGYDMDNMKARAWVSAVQPLLVLNLDNAEKRQWLALLSTKLVDATRTAAAALSFAINSALFDRSEDAGGDPVVPKQRLWAGTEASFYEALRSSIAAGLSLESVTDARRAFLSPLRTITLALFDEAASMDRAPVTAIRRNVSARYSLSGTFRGVGKLGQQLFESLNHATPTADSARKPKRAIAKKGAAT